MIGVVVRLAEQYKPGIAGAGQDGACWSRIYTVSGWYCPLAVGKTRIVVVRGICRRCAIGIHSQQQGQARDKGFFHVVEQLSRSTAFQDRWIF